MHLESTKMKAGIKTHFNIKGGLSHGDHEKKPGSLGSI